MMTIFSGDRPDSGCSDAHQACDSSQLHQTKVKLLFFWDSHPPFTCDSIVTNTVDCCEKEWRIKWDFPPGRTAARTLESTTLQELCSTTPRVSSTRTRTRSVQTSLPSHRLQRTRLVVEIFWSDIKECPANNPQFFASLFAEDLKRASQPDTNKKKTVRDCQHFQRLSTSFNKQFGQLCKMVLFLPGHSVVPVQEVDGPADENSRRMQSLLHPLCQAQWVQEATGEHFSNP